VMGELALVQDSGARRDLCQGEGTPSSTPTSAAGPTPNLVQNQRSGDVGRDLQQAPRPEARCAEHRPEPTTTDHNMAMNSLMINSHREPPPPVNKIQPPRGEVSPFGSGLAHKVLRVAI
jgi:hypothetical protein